MKIQYHYYYFFQKREFSMHLYVISFVDTSYINIFIPTLIQYDRYHLHILILIIGLRFHYLHHVASCKSL